MKFYSIWNINSLYLKFFNTSYTFSMTKFTFPYWKRLWVRWNFMGMDSIPVRYSSTAISWLWRCLPW